MSKKHIIQIDGKSVEVSEEVYTYLRRSDWNSDYADTKRKRERIEVDKKREKVRFIPGKEDSFDRLTEIGIEFPEKGASVSDQAIQKIIVEQALDKLTADERYIIVNIYFNERTERELAKELGKTQQAISKSKARILLKLHEILK